MPKVCRSVLLPDFAFSWDSNHSPHKVVLSKGFHSSYVLFGEKTTCRIVLSCFVIVIGYALGIGGEINFSLKGTLFGLGASIVGAFYTILLKYYLSYVMPDRWELTFYNNFNSCLVMPLLIYVVLLQPFYVQLNGGTEGECPKHQPFLLHHHLSLFACYTLLTCSGSRGPVRGNHYLPPDSVHE